MDQHRDKVLQTLQSNKEYSSYLCDYLKGLREDKIRALIHSELDKTQRIQGELVLIEQLLNTFKPKHP